MRVSIIIVLVMTGVFLNAQNTVNNYKYVIISKQFSFQKSENEYQLNDLAKFLFEKYNFNPVFEGSYPEDLYRNNCLGLQSKIVNESSLFVTKLKVELRDCKGNLIYTSGVGRSKQKEYRATYQEAMRNAFRSFKDLNYKYEPQSETVTEITNDIEKDKDVAEKKVGESSENTSVVTTENKAEVAEVLVANPQQGKAILYAQQTEFGFQLVDTTPSIRFLLYETSVKDLYILKDAHGIFYKEGDSWVAEYLDKGKTIKQIFSVKF
ncbi:hypothetical protein ACJD0Z_05005 [Flavobacteriaceae bacterium M23B6Z8]